MYHVAAMAAAPAIQSATDKTIDNVTGFLSKYWKHILIVFFALILAGAYVFTSAFKR